MFKHVKFCKNKCVTQAHKQLYNEIPLTKPKDSMHVITFTTTFLTFSARQIWVTQNAQISQISSDIFPTSNSYQFNTNHIHHKIWQHSHLLSPTWLLQLQNLVRERKSFAHYSSNHFTFASPSDIIQSSHFGYHTHRCSRSKPITAKNQS
jgi:hypothetical protein